MLFKRSKPNQSRRRQPDIPRGTSQVFSYHANRSAGAGAGATRKAGGLPWSAVDPSPSSRPRTAHNRLLKRVRNTVAALAAFVLLVNSLLLSTNPQVIALSDAPHSQKVFLRSSDTYRQAAEALLNKSLASNTKLTVNTAKLSSELKRQFPELAEASVVLPVLGRRPLIYLQPALPVLLFKTSGGAVYLLDTTGRALANASEVPQVEKLGLQLVEDQSGLTVELNDAALPSKNIAFITEIIGQLKAKGVAVAGIVLPRDAGQLDLRVNGAAYTVKFNLRGDARAEVGTYLAAKTYLERGHIAASNYIDVRVDNRAYYR